MVFYIWAETSEFPVAIFNINQADSQKLLSVDMLHCKIMRSVFSLTGIANNSQTV